MFTSFLSRAKWAIVGFFESPIDTLITRRLIDFYARLERDGIIRHVIPGSSSGVGKRPLDRPSPSDASSARVPDQREYIGG